MNLLFLKKLLILLMKKKHLSKEGKLEMIKFYHEMKKPYLAPLNKTQLTIQWLGEFTDGDGSFSISNYNPRLKFEIHIKEIELFNRIKNLFNINNNLNITKSRKNRPNSNPTVNLDITDIDKLKKSIVPLYSKVGILKTKKLKDFKDWCLVVDIYFFGYHLLPEGKLLITEIKNTWNNFRLSTHYKKNNLINLSNFENKFKTLFSFPSPYEIKMRLDLLEVLIN
uniref:LAGLIDADG homing endonuclease n=1 Tax=Tricholoma bakamatsutake TaxID=51221 RepID=A0A6C0W508_9AGAR|nr:LAGLIDADG homing endonuclease [Tricholoma bakamatsutake]QIC20200.1 LAGLIDADG homing endonuclease [Tricholoma bakamatsutake]